MMIKQMNKAEQWAVRILCALALVCVGSLHRPPQALAHPGATLEYALPDGTLPILCLPSQNNDLAHHADLVPGCEACRFSASTMLPDPVDGVGRPMALASGRLPFALKETDMRPPVSPHISPRGPPSEIAFGTSDRAAA